jgi:hypothetical protein
VVQDRPGIVGKTVYNQGLSVPRDPFKVPFLGIFRLASTMRNPSFLRRSLKTPLNFITL